MRRNWPFFKDSDWLILVFVHSAKPTAELKNLAMSPSLSSPGLSYDTKFVQIGWELRSSLVGDTILGVQSEPACRGGPDVILGYRFRLPPANLHDLIHRRPGQRFAEGASHAEGLHRKKARQSCRTQVGLQGICHTGGGERQITPGPLRP